MQIGVTQNGTVAYFRRGCLTFIVFKCNAAYGCLTLSDMLLSYHLMDSNALMHFGFKEFQSEAGQFIIHSLAEV